MDNMELQGKPLRILILDGGDIGGVFSAQVLAIIEKGLGIDIFNTFDLIIGASTGSVIVGAAKSKHSVPQLVEKYKRAAPLVSKKKLCDSCMVELSPKSKYRQFPLKIFPSNALGDVKLGGVEQPLILNATNMRADKVHLIEPRYQARQRGEDYTKDRKASLSSTVLVPYSAPMCFDPVYINEKPICNGALWANGPDLVAYVKAERDSEGSKNIKIFLDKSAIDLCLHPDNSYYLPKN